MTSNPTHLQKGSSLVASLLQDIQYTRMTTEKLHLPSDEKKMPTFGFHMAGCECGGKLRLSQSQFETIQDGLLGTTFHVVSNCREVTGLPRFSVTKSTHQLLVPQGRM